jgi:hypothetical protein
MPMNGHAVIFTAPFFCVVEAHKSVVQVPEIRIQVPQYVIIRQILKALFGKSCAKVMKHLALLRIASLDDPLGPFTVSEAFLRVYIVQVLSLIGSFFLFFFF